MFSLISGVITGCLAIIGVILTSYLTRKREREAVLRQTKLEHYREYVAGLSGIVEGRAVSAEAHERYADAVNGLMLVASGRVLKALYSLLAETSSRNRSQEVHDALLNDLLKVMREDVLPGDADASELPPFRLTTVPPLAYRDMLSQRATATADPTART